MNILPSSLKPGDIFEVIWHQIDETDIHVVLEVYSSGLHSQDISRLVNNNEESFYNWRFDVTLKSCSINLL